MTLRPARIRVVRPSEWVAAPWRNGGGVTHEIAREGPADAFSWRVSVADVAQAGPFSSFPGIDRVIALVEGDGFALQGGVDATLRTVGEWTAFPGDVPVHCTLLGGPVRDLNVMVDRKRWAIDVRRGSGDLRVDGALLLAFALGPGDLDGAALGRHDLVISERDVPIRADCLVARLRRR